MNADYVCSFEKNIKLNVGQPTYFGSQHLKMRKYKLCILNDKVLKYKLLKNESTYVKDKIRYLGII